MNDAVHTVSAACICFVKHALDVCEYLFGTLKDVEICSDKNISDFTTMCCMNAWHYLRSQH